MRQSDVLCVFGAVERDKERQSKEFGCEKFSSNFFKTKISRIEFLFYKLYGITPLINESANKMNYNELEKNCF